jgi:hypothetical protein
MNEFTTRPTTSRVHNGWTRLTIDEGVVVQSEEAINEFHLCQHFDGECERLMLLGAPTSVTNIADLSNSKSRWSHSPYADALHMYICCIRKSYLA